MSTTTAFADAAPYLVGLAIVSATFYACSKNASPERLVVSAHASFFVLAFVAAITVSSFVGRNIVIEIALVASQLGGLLLIGISIRGYRGPPYLHALQAFTLVLAFMLLFIGMAYVSGI